MTEKIPLSPVLMSVWCMCSQIFVNFHPFFLWETAKMCFTVLGLAFAFLLNVKKGVYITLFI